MNGRTVLAAALLAHPAAAAAQAIGGRVVDAATGHPVARVGVFVRDVQHPTTDTLKDGTFVIALPGLGRYRLEFVPDAGAPYVTDSIDVGPGAFVQREFPLTLRPDPIYLEFQVDKPAVPAPGNMGPRYPAELKRRNVNGAVLAMFVVDTTGRVRPGSYRVVRATDTAFVSSVAASLATAKFVPAERDGRKVPQIVRMPFEFCMTVGHDRPASPLTGRPYCQ